MTTVLHPDSICESRTTGTDDGICRSCGEAGVTLTDDERDLLHETLDNAREAGATLGEAVIAAANVVMTSRLATDQEDTET